MYLWKQFSVKITGDVFSSWLYIFTVSSSEAHCKPYTLNISKIQCLIWRVIPSAQATWAKNVIQISNTHIFPSNVKNLQGMLSVETKKSSKIVKSVPSYSSGHSSTVPRPYNNCMTWRDAAFMTSYHDVDQLSGNQFITHKYSITDISKHEREHTQK